MAVQSSKIGAIIGMVGSTIFMITGLFGITIARIAYYPDPYYPMFLPYITGLLTIALSATGIVGAVLVLRGSSWGYFTYSCRNCWNSRNPPSYIFLR